MGILAVSCSSAYDLLTGKHVKLNRGLPGCIAIQPYLDLHTNPKPELSVWSLVLLDKADKKPRPLDQGRTQL